MRKTFREYRIEKGFRTSYVAEVLGISVNTLCHKESGKRSFTLHEVEKLLTLYNIQLADVKY